MASNTRYFNNDVRNYLHALNGNTKSEEEKNILVEKISSNVLWKNSFEEVRTNFDDDVHDDLHVLLEGNTRSAEEKDILVEKILRNVRWKTLSEKEGTVEREVSVHNIHEDLLWQKARDLFYSDLGKSVENIKDDTVTIEDTISNLKSTQKKVSKEYGNHELFSGVNFKLSSVLKRLELILQVRLRDPSISLETDEVGATPLHWAASRGNVEIVRILLDKGDVPANYMRDKADAIPLHCAASKGNAETVRTLLGKDNVSMICLEIDQSGATPMHCAASIGYVETLRLLDHGDPSAVNMCDNDGATPLHFAALRGYADAANLLFSRGSDPTLEDKYYKTPLERMFMAWAGIFPDEINRKERIERTIKLLMSRILTITLPTVEIQRQQLDLIQFAIEKSNVNICNAINKDLVNKEDSHGWTSVLLAVQIQRRDIIELLSQYDTQNIIGTFSQKRDSQTSLGHAPTKWSPFGKHSRVTIAEGGLEATLDDSDGSFLTLNQEFLPRVTSWYDIDSPLACAEPQYQNGDVIGCGIDFREEKIFYTKDGKLLKSKSINTARRLFPCIQMRGEQIKTRVNFDPGSFVYQDWPYEEKAFNLSIYSEGEGEGEQEDLVLGRPAEDRLESQIITEVAGNAADEIQADHEKEGKIMSNPQQQDKQDKVVIESKVRDGQGQALIEPSPLLQEGLEVIIKPQVDHQENQKEIDSGVGKVDAAVDTVEAFETPVTPQGPKRRKKFSRVLRKLISRV
ncbi:hypothetical protein NHQ30_003145 [Ciborinia camelliae]|nr:hypothetical protein NHQ30_003145 [Ciborinia camelliae]